MLEGLGNAGGDALRLLRIERQDGALFSSHERREKRLLEARGDADDRELALVVLVLAANGPAERRAHGFRNQIGILAADGGIGDGFENRRQVANRNVLAQELSQ